MRVEVVIVGGGHNGLAMSKRLSDRGIEHVVLERGEVAELVANRALGLVHAAHAELAGPAPGSGLRRRRPGRLHDRRRDRRLRRPGTPRRSTRRSAPGRPWSRCARADDGYDVVTDQGVWRGRCVVLASGACNTPSPTDLRRGRPDLRRTGQPAAVPQSRAASRRRRARRGRGGHRRAARRGDPRVGPTGDALGGRARPDAADLPRSRHPALDGGDRAARRALRRGRGDPPGALGGLAAADRHPRASDARPEPAQRCRGRSCAAGSAAIRDGVALFSGGLRNHCALADQKLDRLLDDIDAWIERPRARTTSVPVERYEPTRVARGIPLTLDLSAGQIRTIVWATGFKPDLSWVDLPVFDADGPAPPRRRRGRRARRVLPRGVVPAPPQVELHPRRRRRHPRPGRPPGPPPRASAADQRFVPM